MKASCQGTQNITIADAIRAGGRIICNQSESEGRRRGSKTEGAVNISVFLLPVQSVQSVRPTPERTAFFTETQTHGKCSVCLFSYQGQRSVSLLSENIAIFPFFWVAVMSSSKTFTNTLGPIQETSRYLRICTCMWICTVSVGAPAIRFFSKNEAKF